MTRLTEETEAVAPLLRLQIKGYEKVLNIVERPSVGSLALPTKICTLINNILSSSLSSFVNRGTTKVYVRCGYLTPSKLILEITADPARPPRDERHANYCVQKMEKGALSFGGEFVTDVTNGPDNSVRDVFFRLIVPIPA